MKRFSKYFIPWFLVAVWMSMLFYFSAQTSSVSSGTSGSLIRSVVRLFVSGFDKMTPESQASLVEGLQFFVRKAAHFSGYALLGLLLYIAFLQHGLTKRKHFLASLIVAALYAVSDEVHQNFVEGRSAQFSDVCLDVCGALAGILFIKGLLYLIHRKSSKVFHGN